MNYSDKDIKNIFWGNRQFNRHAYKKYIENKENIILYNFIISNKIDNESIKETIYRLANNIKEHPKCPICGNKINFVNTNKGYNIGCSQSCINKITYENQKQKLIKQYGVTNISQLPEIKEKIKQTFLNNYGVNNPNKVKEVRDKIKNTCLKKYGVTHHWKLDDIKEKRHQTWLNKYGVDVCSQNELVKQKMSQTCQIKYGVKWFTQSKQLIKASNTEETKNKEYKTKLKNNSFNKSKTEDLTYELLKEKYTDVKRQYKSDLYPFNCDFYIPSLNLYIECNYHWTHGGHPFDKDNENDNAKLKNMLNKINDHKFYKKAIYVWIELDVKKRNIAKQNNLNYIEFWNINEAINWINNYKI